MYEAFYGLRERPFELTANPRYLFLTGKHREALSTLIYGLSARKGLTVLTGDAGTGKTTLLCAALAQWQAAGHLVVALRNPTLTRAEFLEFMAREFGLSAEAGRSKTLLLQEMEALLRQRHDAGLLTALVLDEAHSMPIELLEEVRLLANIENADTKLLPLIMLGQPELADRLNQPELRQLKQRIALRSRLDPLDLRETAAYIAKRIRLAGGDSLRAFTREAVTAIHVGSGGIPRLINVICDNALVNGLAANEQPVGRDIILEVCADFDLPTEPAAADPRRAAASAADAAAKRDATASAVPTTVSSPSPARTHAVDGGRERQASGPAPARAVAATATATVDQVGLLDSAKLIPIDAAPTAESDPPVPDIDESRLRRLLRRPFSFFARNPS
jgi:general secretion pathway protein A